MTTMEDDEINKNIDAVIASKKSKISSLRKRYATATKKASKLKQELDQEEFELLSIEQLREKSRKMETVLTTVDDYTHLLKNNENEANGEGASTSN